MTAYAAIQNPTDWNFKKMHVGIREQGKVNHDTITNCRSLPLHTDILNDVTQQDGRPHTIQQRYYILLYYTYNDNKVWLYVFVVRYLRCFGKNYKRTRTFAIVLLLRTNLQVFLRMFLLYLILRKSCALNATAFCQVILFDLYFTFLIFLRKSP